MLLPTIALALLVGAGGTSAGTGVQEEPTASPDTLLVLKNGAEVRGVFLSLADGKYSIRLANGREMKYPADEVERMERLAVSPAPSTTPTSPTAPARPPQPCTIFLTEGSLDASLYTDLKEIKISKKWYGGSDEMNIELADRLKKIKADGAYGVHTWQAPSGFSWSAPHIAGHGFKWSEAGQKALPGLKGRCF